MLKSELYKASVAHLNIQAFRQIGHFFYEKQDKDIERLKFGHKDKSKKEAVVFVVVAIIAYFLRDSWMTSVDQFVDIENIELDEALFFLFTMTLIPHFVEITHEYVSLIALTSSSFVLLLLY